MPSIYTYRHVELDNVGRGKRVIQPPGGQTADIFGQREDRSSSSASSQVGSDVASARMMIDIDQQSVGGQSSSVQSVIVDGPAKSGQVSPALSSDSQVQGSEAQAAGRTPKKTIPTLRRNPITGEVYDTPANPQMPVRVRQPPGGKSSGIF